LANTQAGVEILGGRRGCHASLGSNALDCVV